MDKSRFRYIPILLFPVFILVSCTHVEIPSGTMRESESDLFSRVKPVFIMPTSDMERGNGIEAIFFDQRETADGAVIEITVVFLDEDHPSLLVDGLYDIYRRFRYHRVKDVETFFLYFSVNGIPFSRFEFPGTYAGEQSFYKKDVEHFSAVVPAVSFEYIESRAIIHVTTWNHMFRETATDTGIATTAIVDYPVYPGSRADVEVQSAP